MLVTMRRLVLGDAEEPTKLPDFPPRPNGEESPASFRELVWIMFDRSDKRMDRMEARQQTGLREVRGYLVMLLLAGLAMAATVIGAVLALG